MFLAATDTCEHCKSTIYPDDEKVNIAYDNYHFECAESLGIEETNE